MNSTIEVSQNIIAIAGTERPSEFRLNQLRQSISLEEAKNIESREIYFCELDQDLTSIPEEEIKELSKLLSGSEELSFLNNSFFLITPRIGTISPWSSKATEITNNCGFDFIKRIEIYRQKNSRYTKLLNYV